MANNDVVTGDLNYADRLWKAADTLRGQVDAAEYKHVVLGLLFLKYISDSFESRRDDLRAELTKDGILGEQLERLLESRDEYTAERVFWVPTEARWSNLQNQATRPDIATLIDDAILAVERDNANLKGKLPRDYARRGIEPVKMKALIDLIADIGFKGDHGKARDMLGRVYEYFLGKFAAAEGKLGGEYALDARDARSKRRDSSPLSAASTANFRTAVSRTLIETGPSFRASRDTRQAATTALVKPSRVTPGCTRL